MYTTRIIAGYEVSCICSKSGILRSATVLVGDPDKAGFRSKDGKGAKDARRQAKEAVIKATGLPSNKVKVSARYSCLRVSGGMIERLDESGRVIGIYET
jgi:hypothetical protein